MMRRSLCVLVMGLVCAAGFAQKRAEQGRAERPEWRTATAAELSAVLPLRAPVVKERIETEMRSATGVIDGRGRVIAAVVLITAGYAANGKYSHYLLLQSPIRLGGSMELPAGGYLIGWTRGEQSLQVHIYDAATGKDHGVVEAAMLPRTVTVVPIKIWPPTERGIVQIGRFGMAYMPVE